MHGPPEASYSFDLQDQLLEFAPTCHHGDAALLELTEEFLRMEPAEPQIFYVWGHSYEFDVHDGWSDFEEFLKRISGRKDIFYGTNTEVLLRI